MNVAVLSGAGAAGHLQVWPDDRPSALADIQYGQNSTRSSLVVVPPGSDGGVKIQNSSTGTINIVLDVEGWYSRVGDAKPNGQTRTQQSVTLQGNPNGGGTYVTYQYRIGTTGPFGPVPTANVAKVADGSTPASWPVRNASGTVDAYTWNVRNNPARRHRVSRTRPGSDRGVFRHIGLRQQPGVHDAVRHSVRPVRVR